MVAASGGFVRRLKVTKFEKVDGATVYRSEERLKKVSFLYLIYILMAQKTVRIATALTGDAIDEPAHIYWAL